MVTPLAAVSVAGVVGQATKAFLSLGSVCSFFAFPELLLLPTLHVEAKKLRLCVCFGDCLNLAAETAAVDSSHYHTSLALAVITTCQ